MTSAISSRRSWRPGEAVGLARGLDAALTPLKLVGGEVAKGAGGLPPVVANAEAMTRGALADVLRLAPASQPGLDALARVRTVASRTQPEPARETTPSPEPRAPAALVRPNAPTAPPGSGRLPTFGQLSAAYIQMRIDRDGGEIAEIGSLRLRARTWIELMGDRPVDQYYPRDLQTYVNAMRFWPANVTKHGAFVGMSTRDIIEANRDRAVRPISRKALEDGYVANIKTMMRHGIADFHYRDPSAGAKIS